LSYLTLLNVKKQKTIFFSFVGAHSNSLEEYRFKKVLGQLDDNLGKHHNCMIRILTQFVDISHHIQVHEHRANEADINQN